MVSLQQIRLKNLKTIYQLINRNNGISRASIAKMTKLSKAAVSSLVDELITDGYIVDCGTTAGSNQGRRPNMLSIQSDDNLVAVFNWSRMKLESVLVRADGTISFREENAISTGADAIEIIRQSFFRSLLPEVANKRLMGICIIIPGIIDSEKHYVLSTVLGIGENDDVLSRLERAFSGYPLCILNDTACFAYAESVLTDISQKNYAYVNISKGVGACLFADGKMLRGAGAIATQFGHFSIDRRGPICACGNRGCLECMVGESFLARRITEIAPPMDVDPPLGTSFHALAVQAYRGERRAQSVIRTLAQDMAYGISNLVALFHPSLIVIGGSGVELGSQYLQDIQEELHNTGFPEFMKTLEIRFSSLNLDAKFVGASRYFIDTFYHFGTPMSSGLYI